VKYRLLNDENVEVLSSARPGQEDADADGFVSSANEFIILHRPEGKEPSEAPFKLRLEYKYDGRAKEAH